ncbi:uncharacterized protein Dwil_GK25156 [Drosophila willistoni]|uniref:DUF753 domain-containing protein n=1 Tax=Drosophila willistoni TaxID=7260 RepID=B4N409_DROWI|nr:uncharacterized protein LOC6645463 [Drosophila willistoni]EDW79364.2 uncharacterized protein Dwil_GK25156 [Drosophila willistoni]
MPGSYSHPYQFLLAVCLIACAPTQGFVTSSASSSITADKSNSKLLQTLGDAAKSLQAAQKSLEAAAQFQTPSVVQDLSLVCKELCGAGLGVALCVGNCATPIDADITKTKILNSNFDLVKCKQLCGLHLDGLDCECDGSSISMEDAPKGKEVSSDAFGDRLCTSFCHQRHNTLPGCSPCQLIVGKVIDMDKKMALKASGMQGITTHGADPSEYLTKVEQALANAVEAVAEETTDTPDWNELCKVLCKTGDGGSLCNCDLSPFST